MDDARSMNEDSWGWSWPAVVALLVVVVASLISGLVAMFIADKTDGYSASYYDGGNRFAFAVGAGFIPLFVTPVAVLAYIFVLAIWRRWRLAAAVALLPAVCVVVGVPILWNS
jgi:hypothetical protein